MLKKQKRYEQVAAAVAERIRSGDYPPGFKLPGTRSLAGRFGVSISTVVEAQRLLERWGLVIARPRSGYYVRLPGAEATGLNRSDGHSEVSLQPSADSGAVVTGVLQCTPRVATTRRLVLELVQATHRQDLIPLGAAVQDSRYIPVDALNRALRRVTKLQAGNVWSYEFAPGNPVIRERIAERMQFAGVKAHRDDIVLTHGCHDAMLLALHSVCQPGDIVAVESPTYYGLLQVLETLQLKVLEIPVHPGRGLQADALALAIQQWPIKACIWVSNFSNPLGILPSAQSKREIVQLLAEHNIPLIENDVYGELGFLEERPPAAKKFDQQGGVFYCASFSKSLAPGARLGWIMPGKSRDAVQYGQFASSVATPSIPQYAFAELLQSGDFDRHLRRVRSAYYDRVMRASGILQRYFPATTRISDPAGGFVLWLTLPDQLNAMKLYQRALKEGISFAPGPLFSTAESFQSCLRINCAVGDDDALKWALISLAKLLPELDEKTHA
ncbi:MAG: PLP-dependent aminotransferase family protein [Pseudomonadales bacterium]|nr:PLP-dependent aminotransferase family protein [Pseudomonadales bacterium]